VVALRYSPQAWLTKKKSCAGETLCCLSPPELGRHKLRRGAPGKGLRVACASARGCLRKHLALDCIAGTRSPEKQIEEVQPPLISYPPSPAPTPANHSTNTMADSSASTSADGPTLQNRWKAAGGFFEQYTHQSSSTQTPMRFTIFLPPQATSKPVPILYYLSGLTCTDENVVQKGFVQFQAAKRGLAIVCPDTSPRGAGVEGEDEGWDFGTGAGFYVDATAEKWKK